MEKHSENIKRLEDRIQQMGLQQEYVAFRDRFLEWRKGEATGARGEMIDEREHCDTFGDRGLKNKRNLAANRGFGFWYPTVQEWLWKRTMSYWISVTFLEGSFFFCFSSFCYNYVQDDGTPDWDDGTFEAVTLWGYLGGKINFFVCTYLMCLETVNFSAGHADGVSERQPSDCSAGAAPGRQRSDSVASGSPLDSPSELASQASPSKDHPPAAALNRRQSRLAEVVQAAPSTEKAEPFFWNPFRYRKAKENLERAGLNVLPYVTALVYFVGVLLFTVGMVCEFLPGGCWRFAGSALGWRNLQCCSTGCSDCVLKVVKRYAFIFGATCFLAGGVVECVQNYGNITRRSCSSSLGFVVGFLNSLGGACYLSGSWTLDAYLGNFLFGVGSIIFIVSSSIQIWMWKDEQFGLSFLAALNDYHSLSQRPRNDRKDSFSGRGAFFVWLYCYCGAVSAYNFTIEVARHFSLTRVRSDQMAFNELLPFIFAHMMLLLTSAVVRVPPGRPYRQMYILLRLLSVALALNSTLTLWEFLSKGIQT